MSRGTPLPSRPDYVQPGCADCGQVTPLILGVATSRGDRVPFCPVCSAELAAQLLEALR